MLKTIRNLNLGWILLLIGMVIIVSGISMTEGKAGEKTFLCFDSGCIYVQGISNIALGILTIILGVHLIVKKLRQNRNRRILRNEIENKPAENKA